MNNFKKGGFKKGGGAFGDRPKFSGNKKFGSKFEKRKDKGDRFGARMELFPAVCSQCRKDCQVPFRPTGDKPVYCRDCFSRQEQVPGRNSNGRDRFGKDFQKDDHAPRAYQPTQTRAPSEEGIDALKRQLALLESKVNRILELVSKNR